MCTLFRHINSGRVGSEKVSILLSEINLPAPGNRPELTKKPATESRVAQGAQEYANPYSLALKPPSRSWTALLHPEEKPRTLGDLGGFLIKWFRK